MQKQIFAHRGAHKIHRENTLPAFSEAIGKGADGVELDVRKTKDGELVIFHDPEIGGREIKDLRYLDIEVYALMKNFSVPTLQAALAVLNGRVKIQIEIKEQGYEEEVVRAALKILKPEDFIIISFNFKSIEKIKSGYPEIALGLLVDTKFSHFIKIVFYSLAKKNFIQGVNLLCLNWRFWKLGLSKFIFKGHALGVWTANEKEILESLLLDRRVLAITTDEPELALQLREQINNENS